jgi:large subunit ribosomal protein L21
MYAVIETGGKQYRVQPGDILQVEKLEGELGAHIKFDQVLFFSKANPENPEIILGKPYISGANIEGEIAGQGRGEKILIVKMKRRKQYRRTQGHRQSYTQILITSLDRVKHLRSLFWVLVNGLLLKKQALLKRIKRQFRFFYKFSRGRDKWHTKKLVVVPAMVAIVILKCAELSGMEAKRSIPVKSLFAKQEHVFILDAM